MHASRLPVAVLITLQPEDEDAQDEEDRGKREDTAAADEQAATMSS